jgi:TRAP-type transport system small permease protein
VSSARSARAATPIRLLAAVNDPVARIGRNLSAALLALMVAVALAQILSRALFSYTLDWAEELARMALVWSVFLVAPFAYRAGAHVAIVAFAEALPRTLLLVLALLANLLIVWICGVFFLESFGLVRRGLTIVASSLPVAMAFIYVVVPVSLAALMLVGLEHALRLFYACRDPGAPVALSGLVPMVQRDESQDRALQSDADAASPAHSMQSSDRTDR